MEFVFSLSQAMDYDSLNKFLLKTKSYPNVKEVYSFHSDVEPSAEGLQELRPS